MVDPLDDAAYLTRSEHRVAVLDRLAEGPRNRTALQEATGASRVTVGRMLGELEDRGWVQREGHDYRLTHAGRIVAEDLARLLETTQTAQTLQEIEPLLPVDRFEFDLRRFGDATVHRPTRSDPNAHMRRMAARLSEADRVRVLAPSVSPVPVRAHRDRVLASPTHEATVVFTAAAAEVALEDPDTRTWFREMHETGRLACYRHDSSYPIDLVVADGTAMLTLYDDASGAGFHSVVETQDETIHGWAVAEFERVREEAIPIESGAFGATAGANADADADADTGREAESASE
jgi:predicted transcriptional regulator